MDTPDLDRIITLLLDADGTLFPSEEPAFVASAVVTEEFARHFGLTGDFSPEHLRRNTTGKNFRSTAQDLLDQQGVTVGADELEEWVEREKDAVSAHLARVLRPRPDVPAALSALSRRYRLAVVSSSALARLAACCTATGLMPCCRRPSASARRTACRCPPANPTRPSTGRPWTGWAFPPNGPSPWRTP
ncbi:hypothetical protein ACF1BE_33045 [Streptomyces sp. NPDC014991]|uniref:hypothetical protein n=1 Tax=Streptomyces sp. NPDC014991 TaxID=3364935 RepID=UPI0036F9091A